LSCDVLVVSAHPDDAELGCGGVVKDLTNRGKVVVMVDCTRGELGTRGTPEIRAAEAQSAGRILGVSDRVNLDFPDGEVQDDTQSIHAMCAVIRRFQPRIMLIPPPIERHPDHSAVHRICTAANFFSGVSKVLLEHSNQQLEPHRAEKLYCYQQNYDFPSLPSFYVDISSTFNDKMDSILAYRSQFHSPHDEFKDQPPTLISRPEFLQELEARARYYGSRIGVNYAEGFYSVQPLGLSTMSVIL
jgi:N-acetylglucosamine malate deacetylase 1